MGLILRRAACRQSSKHSKRELGVFAPHLPPYITLMFADFLRRLTAPAPDQMPDTDARLALGALLVRLARTDGDYAPEEMARIDRILAERYGLADPAALRAQCEALEAEAPDTVRFTRAIKAAVPYVDRRAVICLHVGNCAGGWLVRDEDENSMMRMVAPMLGVEDQDSNAARIAIENRLK